MASLFSHFQKKHFLGIDIGTSSVKIVELQKEGKEVVLGNYGTAFLPVEDTTFQRQSFSGREKTKKALFALLEKMHPEVESAYISVPSYSGLITLIDFPAMSNSELAEAIEFEAVKYIPAPQDEVSLSWNIIEQEKKDENTTQVLLAAALKKDILRYQQLFKDATLSVEALELENFSLTRSLAGNDLGTHLLIDIGYTYLNMILVKNGVIIANRNIDMGGHLMTQEIAKVLQVSYKRAEQLKKDPKRNFFEDREVNVSFSLTDSILTESKRMIEAFGKKYANATVDTILLSGGVSQMQGLKEYLSKELALKVALGNPWKDITYDKNLEAKISALGGEYAVSVGLALRGIKES